MGNITGGRLQPAVHRIMHFQDDFERQLELELMHTEQIRARFLVGVFGFLGLVSTAVWGFNQAGVERFFLGKFNLAAVLALAGAYALYEFLFQAGVGIFRRKGLKFPLFPKYANAIIEASFASILLFMLMSVFPADRALSMPPDFVYFLFIILSALRLEPAVSVVTGAASAIGYLFLVWWGLSPELARMDGVSWLYLALPYASKTLLILVAGVIAAYVSNQIRKRLISVIRTQDERKRIAGIFGQHVSPAVMEKLIHQEESLDSETREVSVLFLDIRDFTTFSHTRRPDEVVRHLNGLFDFMISVVNEHHGFINKFLGDGFMAVFGAPLADGQASLNAIRASLALSGRLAEEIRRGAVEATRIGIGLHSGLAVTGNVGSAERKEYTVIGDVVNLASRLEQLNKHYQSEILVSGETWAAAQAVPGGSQALAGLAAEDLGEVTVKGRATPVRVLRLR